MGGVKQLKPAPASRPERLGKAKARARKRGAERAALSVPLQGDLFADPVPRRVQLHPLWRVWATMRTRCSNPNSANFPFYGGRGIGCDPRWSTSRPFIAWALANGWRPGLQLDRIDNNGPYSPENCRFVTPSENNLNRRKTVRVSDGRPALAVARDRGLSPGVFGYRLCRGWTPEQAAGLVPPPGPLNIPPSHMSSLLPFIAETGVSLRLLRRRIRQGWTYPEAVGLDPPPAEGPAGVVRVDAVLPVGADDLDRRFEARTCSGGVADML